MNKVRAIIGVILGTLLPLLLSKLGFDAAHASTSIQVIMDVTGAPDLSFPFNLLSPDFAFTPVIPTVIRSSAKSAVLADY